MFRRLCNRIFLPAIRFILPGITPRKLILAIILSVIFSYFFYLFVTTRVAGKEWKIWLWGLFSVFFGVLFTRAVANQIKNYLSRRKEIIELMATNKSKK